MSQAEAKTFYLLVCRECGDSEDALVMPFESAQARGKWAAEHTKGTGHARWWVKDQWWLHDYPGAPHD